MMSSGGDLRMRLGGQMRLREGFLYDRFIFSAFIILLTKVGGEGVEKASREL